MAKMLLPVFDNCLFRAFHGADNPQLQHESGHPSPSDMKLF